MKKGNYNILKNVILLKLIYIYNNSLLLKEKKKNVMQTFLFDELNTKSLKFLNLKSLKLGTFSFKFKNLKKKKKIKKSELSNFIWDDILYFLKKNEELIKKFLNKGINYVSEQDLYFYLKSSYINFDSFNLKLKKILRKKRLYKLRNYFRIKYKFIRNKFLNKFFIFFNTYLRYNKFKFFSILSFIYLNKGNFNLFNSLKFRFNSSKYYKDILISKGTLFSKVDKVNSKIVLCFLKRKSKVYSSKVFLNVKIKRRRRGLKRSYKKFLRFKAKRKLRRKKRIEVIFKEIVNFSFLSSTSNVDFFSIFYNGKESSNKSLQVIKNKINYSNCRWRLKEYIYFNNFNFLKNNNIAGYYLWLSLIKKRMSSIKFMFLYYKKLKKSLFFFNEGLLSLNTCLILNLKKIFFTFYFKNIYTKYLAVLKYYNKFLSLLLINLNLKENIKESKDMLVRANILNITYYSDSITPVSTNSYFWYVHKFSKQVALILRDRVFNKVKVYKQNLFGNTLEINKVTAIPLEYNKKAIVSNIYAVDNNFGFFFKDSKCSVNFNYIYLLQVFYFILLYNKFIFYYLKYKNKKNFYFINFNLFSATKLCVSKNKYNYLNLFDKFSLKYKFSFLIFVNILKYERFSLLIFILILKRDFKDRFLKYIKINLLNFILFIFTVKFNLFFIFKNFFKKFKSKQYKKLNMLVSIFSKLNTSFFKNRFFVNNFFNLSYFKENNLYYKKKIYKFYFNLNNSYIYSNYSRRNMNNKKKCILYYIEKKSNIFLVLSFFKTNKVISHASSGQAMDRDFVNSKRQKKGTRAMTDVLEEKFKSKVRSSKLQKLYIVAQGKLNFRVRHLMKYWVVRFKLGIKYLKGVKFLFRLPHHKGLKKSNKRRK